MQIREQLEKLNSEFEISFPNEEACMEKLCQEIQRVLGNKCRKCNSDKRNRPFGSRRVRCCSCGARYSLTAGTFFNRIRNARPWVFIIFVLERVGKVNIAAIMEFAGCAYSSTWQMFHKILLCMAGATEDNISIRSACFSELFTRRSKETPKQQHPREEEAEQSKPFEQVDPFTVPDGLTQVEQHSEGHQSDWEVGSSKSDDLTDRNIELHLDETSVGPEEISSAQEEDPVATLSETESTDPHGGELSEDERTVLALLGSQPVHYDRLFEHTGMGFSRLSASLLMLEMLGLVKNNFDRYTRVFNSVPATELQETRAELLSVPPEAKEAISRVCDFIKSGYGGVSRKYLQSYIYAFWCALDRRRWGRDQLLEWCAAQRPIKESEVESFVTMNDVSLVVIA
jgi:hypothetical protein